MLYLGTSGWSYKDWGRRFYPTGLAAREQLPYLARHFDTVELNASFYRTPAATTFERWRDITPPDFRFAVKVSRGITHLKRLANPADDWRAFADNAARLGPKLGVYLLQFPPSFAATPENLKRLETFLGAAATISPDARLAFELRHRTWFESDPLQLFASRQLCLVQAESSRFPHSPEHFSPAPFAYFRFHGPAKLYASQYSGDDLQHWSGLIQAELDAGKDAYVYFDNDVNGYALEDARRLRELLYA